MSFDVPCDLVRNPGFSTNAVVDNTLSRGKTKKRPLKASYGVVYKNFFKHLCPDYNNNLTLALKDLSQDKVDSTVNIVCMNVQAYNTQF